MQWTGILLFHQKVLSCDQKNGEREEHPFFLVLEFFKYEMYVSPLIAALSFNVCMGFFTDDILFLISCWFVTQVWLTPMTFSRIVELLESC